VQAPSATTLANAEIRRAAVAAAERETLCFAMETSSH
jgi:hypothetical protein